MQHRMSLGIACVALLVFPTHAFAAVPDFDVPDTLSTVTGVLTLLLAVVLLVVTVQLRRVAEGSAIVGNIAYVVGGSLCLSASVLLGFVDRFTASWLPERLVPAAADLLVLMSMLFFTLYFAAVRRALVGFLDAVSAEEAFVVAQAGDHAEEFAAEEHLVARDDSDDKGAVGSSEDGGAGA